MNILFSPINNNLKHIILYFNVHSFQPVSVFYLEIYIIIHFILYILIYIYLYMYNIFVILLKCHFMKLIINN